MATRLLKPDHWLFQLTLLTEGRCLINKEGEFALFPFIMSSKNTICYNKDVFLFANATCNTDILK